jgi:hypothetical protein
LKEAKSNKTREMTSIIIIIMKKISENVISAIWRNEENEIIEEAISISISIISASSLTIILTENDRYQAK